MTCLELAVLDRVFGGAEGAPNRTTVRTRDGQSYSAERTNFAYCQDVVQRNCDRANTSWLFGTNERAAAQCTLDNLPKACPPSLAGTGSEPAQ